jgi:hypothetical protein
MKLSCVALLLTLCAGVVRADEPITGAYVGAGIGRATLHRTRLTRSDVEAHDRGSKILAGYRVLNGLAFEASYADYGKAQKDVRLLGDIDAFSVAVVGLIQLQQLDLFGKAGFGAWAGTSADRTGRQVRDNDIDPILGLGVQYRSGRFAVRAEVEAQALSFAAGNHGRDGDLLDFISVGMSWRF